MRKPLTQFQDADPVPADDDLLTVPAPGYGGRVSLVEPRTEARAVEEPRIVVQRAALDVDRASTRPGAGAVTAMTVFVRALALEVVIGVALHERRSARTVLADIDVGLASFRSAKSDEVADTVDYAAVAQSMKSLVEGRSFRLLERLAEEMASEVLARFDAQWVRIRVAKTGVVDAVESTGVELVMHRASHPEDR
jgi:7,8-dihydroneopterin aldolase/epimerase/oxygenase